MSRILLDTHTFIWYAEGSNRLSERAKRLIDSTPEVYLSIASVWEMTIKASLGKLDVKDDLSAFVEQQIQLNLYRVLPILQQHIYRLTDLPMHHRDPFDRLLICQALEEQMPILSVDGKFDPYEGLNTIW